MPIELLFCLLVVLVLAVCMGVAGNPFGFSAFLSGAVINAIPGIIVQIVQVLIKVKVKLLKLFLIIQNDK